MRFKRIETVAYEYVVTGKHQTGYAVVGEYPYAIFFDGEGSHIKLKALSDAAAWQQKYSMKSTRIVKVRVSPVGVTIVGDGRV
jgi:hypothetical protein